MTCPTPAEKQELADLQSYLRGHAAAGTTPAEGSFTRVINQASPAVRQHILANREFAKFVEDGGRSMPFADRITIDRSQLDEPSQALADRLKTEEVAAGVMERMGTPSADSQHSGPPSMRDVIEASFGDSNEQ